MTLDGRDFAEQDPWEQEPSAEEQARFDRLHDGLLRRRGSLRGQQEQLWACIQAMQSLTTAVVQQLASEPPSLERRIIGRQQVLSDLRVLQAWLLSVEVLLERTGQVEWPPMVEHLARELVGELAPDPHDARRWQLNQLLEHSTMSRDD
ncbi:hypothetical protein KBY65_06255 [Cyanobium sp. Alchichica 3B3-8F6]|uniref:hypothetical protein n=1 Tax=Synechococcales TaxID=1890424 RepID=UPI000B99B337|nr:MULTISPECIES: hypothetical protein [Synechococcales]MCP9882076.1 hypothetical protein [Cyanobium sp. Alchichica 3B3-8F6]